VRRDSLDELCVNAIRMQDTFHAHGEPLGVEEVRLTKRALAARGTTQTYPRQAPLRQARDEDISKESRDGRCSCRISE
jgi:hypothetical protein